MSINSNSSLGEVNQSIETGKSKNFFRTLYAFVGPAYLVSVGYMDPGNWATDLAGGSKFGYNLLWVLLMSNLMALLLQSLAARLGVVRGLDLAQASRQQYPAWVNIPLYILAEIAIAACDLAEIIGMAIGLHLLFGIPLIAGVLITALDTLILLFLLNKGIRKLEAFILSLVGIIGVSFLVEMIIVEPEIKSVVHGLIPESLKDEALYIAIGIIGATVMPHNLYLHSALVQTRKFPRDKVGIKKAIRFNIIDSTIALNLAFFVNAAILILAASAFHKNGLYTVAGIQDAHVLLSNIFGNLAPALFAIALIAAGQSSTITGTLAGQIVMEGYLNLRISPWIRRLLTRLIAIIPALATIYFAGEEKLDDLLVLSQVILSIQLGFAVIPLIHFVSSKENMGEFSIGKITATCAWVVASVILFLNIKLVYEELTSFFRFLGDSNISVKVFLLSIVIFACGLLVYITFGPLFGWMRRKEIKLPHGNKTTMQSFEIRKFNKIAVTLDFTPADLKTLEYAITLGGNSAQYTLIHIVESAGAIRSGNEINDLESQTDFKLLQSYESDLKSKGFDCKIELGFGKPSHSIPKIINAINVDVVVMAAHGHKGIKDLIFGSTLEQVRHNINIPVFIVR